MSLKRFVHEYSKIFCWSIRSSSNEFALLISFTTESKDHLLHVTPSKWIEIQQQQQQLEDQVLFWKALNSKWNIIEKKRIFFQNVKLLYLFVAKHKFHVINTNQEKW